MLNSRNNIIFVLDYGHIQNDISLELKITCLSSKDTQKF